MQRREFPERLPRDPVQRAAAALRVEFLQPATEQRLRGVGVRGCHALTGGDERFPAPADIGVVAQIRVGASRTAALTPVDPAGDAAHVATCASVCATACHWRRLSARLSSSEKLRKISAT